MVNFPLVVSNCALKVSGTFSVSLAGSAEPVGLLVGSALLHETSVMLVKRLNAQIKLDAFMGAKFPRVAAKSHARNSIFSHRACDEAAATGPAAAENSQRGQRAGA